MRNAQWFREEQDELIKKEMYNQQHILEVNKQWERIELLLENFELGSEDKYIQLDERIFDENVDKLQSEDLGFFVDNSDYVSKIYFREEDYNNDITKSNKDNIYDLKDGKHENSRVDNVYNREKAKEDIQKALNKSKNNDKDTHDKIPSIKIEYNNKNGEENYKINDKDVNDISEAIRQALELLYSNKYCI